MSATKVRTPNPHHPGTSPSQSRSTTTPYGLSSRSTLSDSRGMPPLLTPKGGSRSSPQPSQNPRTPSPNYFGFIVDSSNPPDSNPGAHAKKNWDFPQSQGRNNATTPRSVPVESDPEFAAFRRQSEQNAFKLGQGSLSSFNRQQFSDSPIPRSFQSPETISPQKHPTDTKSPILTEDKREEWTLPRRDSAGLMPSANKLSSDEYHARLSLPTNTLDNESSQPSRRQPPRAETVPSPTKGLWAPSMINAEECSHLLQSAPDQILLLDLRAYPQYSESRLQNALNLCIPTTLLKRPSFNIKKLSDTFASPAEKERFSRWREYSYIVVYDQNSMHLKEAVAPIHVLKKFSTENWSGKAWIIKGGFQECAKRCPEMVDRRSAIPQSNTSRQTLSMAPVAPGIAPVAGGCPMPTSKNAANPFFGNIRQNMDLIGGVGQIPIQLPDKLDTSSYEALPQWLQEAADPKNEGKRASEKFLKIEEAEQKRMQAALSGEVKYDQQHPDENQNFQIAGIEKGSKNRYNNIFPYDHARVRLKNVPSSECDYVNASHVKTSYSNKHYIATQAPIPATFNDFWRVIWEQDARVIVMLSAESEGGQIKAHPYWHTGDYGPLKLKLLSEKRVPLDPDTKPLPINSALKRPSLGQRRSTNPHTAAEKSFAKESSSPSSEEIFVIVRHFTLSHSSFPFQPIHEIAQLQYNNWPDFGAPASPTHLLGLLDNVTKSVRGTMTPTPTSNPGSPSPADQKPLVVHCSAGCGRTGTFCTVDSVIDMLQRQRFERRNQQSRSPDAMDIDDDSADWIWRDDVDLIAKAVEDLRSQRLSMVQSLRQFVLCYESVAEWLVREAGGEKGKNGLSREVLRGGARSSYHG